MQIETLCLGCMRAKAPDPICKLCGWDANTPHESSLYLPRGTKLAERYLLGRVLGYGGFGITYLGLDYSLNIRVAVKEYLPKGLATRIPNETSVSIYLDEDNHFEKGLRRFEDEAQAVAQFEGHPGVVSVRDFFFANDTAYMVMHYVEGWTLKNYLWRQGGKLDFNDALEIFRQVMDTLQVVHKKGLLHRDISPGNIYITADKQVKLLDFGAARYAVGQYTQNLSVVLKKGYAPPEQYRTWGKQGAWTDIYATAATLYHSVTGERPPSALDREEEPLQPPRRLGVVMPEKAERALMKAMALPQDDRFQTMDAFQNAIDEAPPHQPSQRPSGPSSRAWKTWLPIAAVTLFGLAVFGWRESTKQVEKEAIHKEEAQLYAMQTREQLDAVQDSLQQLHGMMEQWNRIAFTQRGSLAAGDSLATNPLNSITYHDHFVLELQHPTTLVIEMKSSSFDAYVIVQSPDGTEYKDDNSGSGRNSKLTIDGAQAGTWQIIATSYSSYKNSSGHGRYILEVALTNH